MHFVEHLIVLFRLFKDVAKQLVRVWVHDEKYKV